MYENLTKYLDEFTETEFGTWIVDDKSDGTLEHPLQFPFVDYSIVVDQFIHDFLHFPAPSLRGHKYITKLKSTKTIVCLSI